jgi:hypothetical protein
MPHDALRRHALPLYAKFSGLGNKVSIDHLSGRIGRFILATVMRVHGRADMCAVSSRHSGQTGRKPDHCAGRWRPSPAFAVEEARLKRTTIHMPEYRARVEQEAQRMYQ